MAAGLTETFGPFWIPVLVFLVGLVGYGLLYTLSRWGLLPESPEE